MRRKCKGALLLLMPANFLGSMINFQTMNGCRLNLGLNF